MEDVLIVYIIVYNKLRFGIPELNDLVVILPTSKDECYSDKDFCY